MVVEENAAAVFGKGKALRDTVPASTNRKKVSGLFFFYSLPIKGLVVHPGSFLFKTKTLLQGGMKLLQSPYNQKNLESWRWNPCRINPFDLE